MHDQQAVSADPSARFDRVEALLNAYPDVSDEQLAEMKHWFKRQASAFEVASLASKNPLGYEKFRSDHVDKFSKFDLAMIALVVLAIVGGSVYVL